MGFGGLRQRSDFRWSEKGMVTQDSLNENDSLWLPLTILCIYIYNIYLRAKNMYIYIHVLDIYSIHCIYTD